MGGSSCHHSNLDASSAGWPYLGLFGGGQRRIFVKLKDDPQMAVLVNAVQQFRWNALHKLNAATRTGNQCTLSRGAHPLGIRTLDNPQRLERQDVIVVFGVGGIDIQPGLFEFGKCLAEFLFGTDAADALFLSFLFPLGGAFLVLFVQDLATDGRRDEAGNGQGRHGIRKTVVAAVYYCHDELIYSVVEKK